MNFSKTISFSIERCEGESCFSEKEIDDFINTLVVRTESSQKIIKFDTEDKSKNLRTTVVTIDWT